jgi:hypothetical protein
MTLASEIRGEGGGRGSRQNTRGKQQKKGQSGSDIIKIGMYRVRRTEMEMKKIKGEHQKTQAPNGGLYCKRGLRKRNVKN